MKFEEFRLSEPILRAVVAEGYSIPTPIQAQAIPHVMAGRDLLGCAQTGTGKTAAFALPILQRLTRSKPPATSHNDHRHAGQHNGRQHANASRRIRCLVLSPTRELALQISDSFRDYGRYTGIRHTVVYGGVNQNPQTRALTTGVDILVATPGRLLDLMNQGFVDLSGIEVFVLDEADRMLDMGFIPDIRKVVAKLPVNRQTLFFSATMPPDIRRLAETILRQPVTVHVAATSVAAETVEQSVYFVDKPNKPALLTHFLNKTAITRVLVFTRTKHGADRVTRQLIRSGIHAEAIHGEKSQRAREQALGNFRSLRTPVLVATDIAARGLDIDEISHVVNYDLPNEPETYVHRIGRTGRAGASGIAISFCDTDERPHLKAIERLIRRTIHIKRDLPIFVTNATPAATSTAARRHPPNRGSSHKVPAASGRHSTQRRGNQDPAQSTGRRQFWSRKKSKR